MAVRLSDNGNTHTPRLSRSLWVGHRKLALEAIPNPKSDVIVLLEKAIPNSNQ